MCLGYDCSSFVEFVRSLWIYVSFWLKLSQKYIENVSHLLCLMFHFILSLYHFHCGSEINVEIDSRWRRDTPLGQNSGDETYWPCNRCGINDQLLFGGESAPTTGILYGAELITMPSPQTDPDWPVAPPECRGSLRVHCSFLVLHLTYPLAYSRTPSSGRWVKIVNNNKTSREGLWFDHTN